MVHPLWKKVWKCISDKKVMTYRAMKTHEYVLSTHCKTQKKKVYLKSLHFIRYLRMTKYTGLNLGPSVPPHVTSGQKEFTNMLMLMLLTG